MTARGRYRTARPALNPCGAGGGDQLECLNISRKCRPATGSHQTAIASKLSRGIPKRGAENLTAHHSPKSNEAPLSTASHAGVTVTCSGQTTIAATEDRNTSIQHRKITKYSAESVKMKYWHIANQNRRTVFIFINRALPPEKIHALSP